jgi:GNAT superfamily N-acetyltransferase
MSFNEKFILTSKIFDIEEKILNKINGEDNLFFLRQLTGPLTKIINHPKYAVLAKQSLRGTKNLWSSFYEQKKYLETRKVFNWQGKKKQAPLYVKTARRDGEGKELHAYVLHVTGKFNIMTLFASILAYFPTLREDEIYVRVILDKTFVEKNKKHICAFINDFHTYKIYSFESKKSGKIENTQYNDMSYDNLIKTFSWDYHRAKVFQSYLDCLLRPALYEPLDDTGFHPDERKLCVHHVGIYDGVYVYSMNYYEQIHNMCLVYAYVHLLIMQNRRRMDIATYMRDSTKINEKLDGFMERFARHVMKKGYHEGFNQLTDNMDAGYLQEENGEFLKDFKKMVLDKYIKLFQEYEIRLMKLNQGNLGVKTNTEDDSCSYFLFRCDFGSPHFIAAAFKPGKFLVLCNSMTKYDRNIKKMAEIFLESVEMPPVRPFVEKIITPKNRDDVLFKKINSSSELRVNVSIGRKNVNKELTSMSAEPDKDGIQPDGQTPFDKLREICGDEADVCGNTLQDYLRLLTDSEYRNDNDFRDMPMVINLKELKWNRTVAFSLFTPQDFRLYANTYRYVILLLFFCVDQDYRGKGASKFLVLKYLRHFFELRNHKRYTYFVSQVDPLRAKNSVKSHVSLGYKVRHYEYFEGDPGTIYLLFYIPVEKLFYRLVCSIRSVKTLELIFGGQIAIRYSDINTVYKWCAAYLKAKGRDLGKMGEIDIRKGWDPADWGKILSQNDSNIMKYVKKNLRGYESTKSYIFRRPDEEVQENIYSLGQEISEEVKGNIPDEVKEEPKNSSFDQFTERIAREYKPDFDYSLNVEATNNGVYKQFNTTCSIYALVNLFVSKNKKNLSDKQLKETIEEMYRKHKETTTTYLDKDTALEIFRDVVKKLKINADLTEIYFIQRADVRMHPPKVILFGDRKNEVTYADYVCLKANSRKRKRKEFFRKTNNYNAPDHMKCLYLENNHWVALRIKLHDNKFTIELKDSLFNGEQMAKDLKKDFKFIAKTCYNILSDNYIEYTIFNNSK